MKEYLNEPISSLSHLIGMLLSIAGLVLMVVYASLYGTVWHIVSFSIFGAALIVLYSASTMFHFFKRGKRVKKVFEIIDHSAIFVLIAGTYTPVCLTALRGGWGWSIFGVVWGLAIIGILIKVLQLKISSIFSTSIYVAMGWLIVIAFYPLVKAMSFTNLFWLMLGGILYTVGAVFFQLQEKMQSHRLFTYHDLFHIFVIAGSFCHFWFMFKYILFV